MKILNLYPYRIALHWGRSGQGILWNVLYIRATRPGKCWSNTKGGLVVSLSWGGSFELYSYSAYIPYDIATQRL